MSAVRKDPGPPALCPLCLEAHGPDQCPHLLAVTASADELVRVARDAYVPAHVLTRIVEQRYAAAQPRLVAVAVVLLHPQSEAVLVRDTDTGLALPGGPIEAGEAPRDAGERHLRAQTGLRPRRAVRPLRGRADRRLLGHAVGR